MEWPNASNLALCNYCGQIREIVWVHGHGQCKVCKINIDECCRGEYCLNNIQ